MLVAAALFLASDANATNAIKAERAMRRAEAARFDLAVTLCGDAGRLGDYRRLQAQQQQLESRFQASFGRPAIDWIVMDDRGDCENGRAFRRSLSTYDAALAEARDAMGAN